MFTEVLEGSTPLGQEVTSQIQPLGRLSNSRCVLHAPQNIVAR
jgi:hypothetical protein